MAQLCVTLKQRFFDSNGEPLVGGKLYSFEAGTSTPLATYTDQSGAVENDNPVILDANGEADVWLGNSAYKFVLYDSNDILQWSVDDVTLLGDGSVITDKLADGSVTAPKLATDSVTAIKIAANSVTTAKINDLAVTTAKINDLAVTTAKINDLAVTTAKINDGAITQSKRAALGQQISGAVAAQSTSSTTYIDVSTLTVTITSTGRPIFVGLIPSQGGGGVSYIAASKTSTSANATFAIDRGGTTVAEFLVRQSDSGAGSVNTDTPATAVMLIDPISAGTYTYKIRMKASDGSTTAEIANVKLIAFEL